MSYLVFVGLLLAVVIAIPLLWWHRQRVRRQHTLARLLDGADQLETLLDRSQDRLRALRPLPRSSRRGSPPVGPAARGRSGSRGQRSSRPRPTPRPTSTPRPTRTRAA